MPARHAAIRCMLNRPVLLMAGNDAKLAGLFGGGRTQAPGLRAVIGSGAIRGLVNGTESPRQRRGP